MIYEYQTLKNKYKEYANINQKISLEAKKGHLIKIKKGLYTDNLEIDAPIISNVCYGPSYISFETALSYYGLIPEYVRMYTAACFGKKNRKLYIVDGLRFSYQSIPDEAFPYGMNFYQNEDGIRYKIASKEKCLCDTLYAKYPVRSIKDLKILLFEDLRIDEEEFLKLDFNFIKEIAPLYHSNTLAVLVKYMEEIYENNRRNDSK